MQSVFGDADAPIVVELAQKPDLQGVPGGRARDSDRGAAAVPRRLGAAGTGDRGHNKAEAYNGFSAWTPVRQLGLDRRERPGRAGKSVKWNSLRSLTAWPTPNPLISSGAAQTEWIRAPLSVEDCRCWWPLVVDRNRNVPVWSRPKIA